MSNKNVQLTSGSDKLFPQTTVENITGLQSALDAKQPTLDSSSANANVIAPLYVDTGELRLALGNGLHKVDDDLEVEVKSNGGITLDANGISVDTSVIQAKLTAGTGMDLTSNIATVTGTQYKNASGVAQANALKFVKCTQAEYTALGTYDSDTFYIIVG